MKKPSTYITCDKPFGTLYTGVTAHPVQRIGQHQEGKADSFTARYKLKRLVYIERFNTMAEAIKREKEIKGWPRNRKIKLICKHNPEWVDLSLTLDRLE
jgi:putative endonuclease